MSGQTARTCTISGCDRTYYGRGYCNMHYLRWRRRGDPLIVLTPVPDINKALAARWPQRTLEERFWSYVDRGNGCWIWRGTRDAYGYGELSSKTVDERKTMLKAHRLAFLFTHGNCPENLHVLHSCDNPACVNPAHLRLGTARDNMHDMIERGRAWYQKRRAGA